MAAAARGTILVTGANGGLGSAIIEQIASKPELSAYHGIYTVRDTTRARALTSVFAHRATHAHDVVALDLTKLDNVRQVAEGINVSPSSLVAHILVTFFFSTFCYSTDIARVGIGT